jgi:hypothetical protein
MAVLLSVNISLKMISHVCLLHILQKELYRNKNQMPSRTAKLHNFMKFCATQVQSKRKLITGWYLSWLQRPVHMYVASNEAVRTSWIVISKDLKGDEPGLCQGTVPTFTYGLREPSADAVRISNPVPQEWTRTCLVPCYSLIHKWFGVQTILLDEWLSHGIFSYDEPL